MWYISDCVQHKPTSCSLHSASHSHCYTNSSLQFAGDTLDSADVAVVDIPAMTTDLQPRPTGWCINKPYQLKYLANLHKNFTNAVHIYQNNKLIWQNSMSKDSNQWWIKDVFLFHAMSICTICKMHCTFFETTYVQFAHFWPKPDCNPNHPTLTLTLILSLSQTLSVTNRRQIVQHLLQIAHTDILHTTLSYKHTQHNDVTALCLKKKFPPFNSL